jgi:hypothetical protein
LRENFQTSETLKQRERVREREREREREEGEEVAHGVRELARGERAGWEVGRVCGMARCDAALPSQSEARSVLCACVQCAARNELVPGAACHHVITRSPDHPITRSPDHPITRSRACSTQHVIRRRCDQGGRRSQPCIKPKHHVPRLSQCTHRPAPAVAVTTHTHLPRKLKRCAPRLRPRASGPGCFGVLDVSALLHCYHDLSPSCERTFKPPKHQNTETRERERKGKRWRWGQGACERGKNRVGGGARLWHGEVRRGAAIAIGGSLGALRLRAVCRTQRAGTWSGTRSPDHPITRSPDHRITCLLNTARGTAVLRPRRSRSQLCIKTKHHVPRLSQGNVRHRPLPSPRTGIYPAN